MKYKVIKEFMPDVVVGQEVDTNEDLTTYRIKLNTIPIVTVDIFYIEAHPEIFEPVIEKEKKPIKRKPNLDNLIKELRELNKYLDDNGYVRYKTIK